MAKINQKEYDILKGLDDKWKWIARDGGVFERVCVYSKPPKKGGVCWGTVSPIDEWESLSMSNSFFQFIKWEDEEPYNIQELILEYERDRLIKLFSCWAQEVSGKISEGMKNIGLAINESLSEESEETEVKKDIEWLKRSISDIIDYHYEYPLINGHTQSMINEIKKVMEQADEQETLSQEWIDEYAQGDYEEWVYTEDLQNLLVPKQEEVDQAYKDGYEKGKEHATKVSKPIIPQFVADYIQESHELGVDLGTALTIETDHLNDIKKYIRDNEETFARAWLAYPNIEVEEQKYEVILPAVTGAKDIYLVVDEDSKVYFESMDYIVRNGCLESEFTEKEIKAIDERYWAFAVPVEEEEE